MTSGKHTSPRYLLTLSAEQRKRWEAAARADGRRLAEWIRVSCDRAAAGAVTGVPRRKR